MTDDPDHLGEPSTEELEAMAGLLRDPAVWAEPTPAVEDRVVAAIATEAAAIRDPASHPPPAPSQSAGQDSLVEPDPAAPAPQHHAWPPPAAPSAPQAPLSPTPGQPAGPHTTPTPGGRATGATQGPSADDPAWGAPSSSPVREPTGPIDTTSGASATDGSGRVVDLGARRRSRPSKLLVPLAAAAALVVAVLGAVAVIDVGSSGDEPSGVTVALAPTDSAGEATAVANVDERPNGVRIIMELTGFEPAPEGSFYHVWLVRPEPRNAVSAGTFHMRGGDIGTIEFWAGVSTEIYTTITITLGSEADPNATGERLFAGQLDG